MTCPQVWRIMSVVLVFTVFVSGLPTQSNTGAVLTANGTVSVNSTNVPRSAAIYKGDTVATGDGRADISVPWSKMTVNKNSRIVYQAKSLELHAGSVAVNTRKQMMSVSAAQVNVRPAAESETSYEVEFVCRAVKVHAVQGNVTVVDSDKVYTVNEGDTQTFGKDKLAAKKNGSGDPCALADSASPKPAFTKPIPIWLWLGAAGAAGTAIGIVESGGGNHSVSPSKP